MPATWTFAAVLALALIALGAAHQGAQKFFAENSGFHQEARQAVCSPITGRALPVHVAEWDKMARAAEGK